MLADLYDRTPAAWLSLPFPFVYFLGALSIERVEVLIIECSALQSEPDFSLFDLDCVSSSLDSIDMWRQEVSRNQIPDKKSPDGSLPTSGNVETDSFPFHTNGNGSFSMPQGGDGYYPRTTEIEPAGSIAPGASPTEATFSNMESSNLSTFSPGMESMTCASSQSFPALEAPAYSFPVNDSVDGTNQASDATARPSEALTQHGAQKHLPGCPHAHGSWVTYLTQDTYPSSSASQDEKIHPAPPHAFRYGAWQPMPGGLPVARTISTAAPNLASSVNAAHPQCLRHPQATSEEQQLYSPTYVMHHSQNAG